MSIKLRPVVIVLVCLVSLYGGPAALAAPFTSGDVFAAVGDGNVRHYSASGTLIETLSLGVTERTTGMAFDAAGNLYATGFDANVVKVFNNQGVLQGSFGSGYSFPESIVFDKAGDVYVSSVGATGIRKFDSSGHLLATILAGTRVDWMDLAADQTTMLYGQEGSAIHRVNVATNTPLSDFGAANEAFALRILPDGSVLLANGGNILHYNAAGTVIKTYTIPGSNTLFALNLDPNGTSFWTGDIGNGVITKLDIATGNILETINTGVPDLQPTRALAGVAIFGEPTAGGPGPAAVGAPEPASLTLLSLGALGLLGYGWRRRQQAQA
jgi:hypothetical protein